MSCTYCSDYEIQLEIYSIVSDMGSFRCPICGKEIKDAPTKEKLKELLKDINGSIDSPSRK